MSGHDGECSLRRGIVLFLTSGFSEEDALSVKMAVKILAVIRP